MHNSSFSLKVSDLLRNPGKIDHLSFEGLFTDLIPHLSSDGIRIDISIQGVSDGSVKVIIDDLYAVVHDVCDLSGESYDRVVHVSERSASYDQSIGFVVDEKVYDDVFPFSNEHETINIEDFVAQSIQLEEPLVHIKPGNEHLLDQFESGDDD